MREKVKVCEAKALTEEKFTKFRETAFKGIQEMYEYFSEEEQRIFDLGELYGRLKMMEELMNDEFGELVDLTGTGLDSEYDAEIMLDSRTGQLRWI